MARIWLALEIDAHYRTQLRRRADDLIVAGQVALTKESGFEISKADWIKYQASQTQELSDEELEGVAGGGSSSLLSRCYW